MILKAPRSQKPGDEKEDEKTDSRVWGTHPGDLGVIVIAAFCTLALLFMLILPSPFARLEKQQAAAEKAEKLAAQAKRQKEIDAAIATGVVSVGIAPVRP